jgi:hypothetical protein
VKNQQVIALIGFVALFTVVCTAMPAHHAAAGYEKSKPVTLKGLVTEWRWRNPHVFLVWKVADNQGSWTQWTGELASPMIMTSLGLTRLTFKAGDKIVAEVFPASDGTPHSVIRKVLMNDRLIVDKNPLAGGDLK